MSDPIHYRAAGIDSLRWSAANVSPDDGADLPKVPAVITCLVTGNISVICAGGGTVTFHCEAGQVLPVFVDRVRVTETTATGIVALYGQ